MLTLYNPYPYTSTPVQSQSLADFALRRRKSTGTKVSRSRASTQPAPLPPPPRAHPAASSPDLRAPRAVPLATTKSSPLPRPAAPAPAAGPLKFSTADRTILEELRRTISARAAQFVLKGPQTSRVRHHPYPREEVPYPRSYAREAVDL